MEKTILVNVESGGANEKPRWVKTNDRNLKIFTESVVRAGHIGFEVADMSIRYPISEESEDRLSKGHQSILAAFLSQEITDNYRDQGKTKILCVEAVFDKKSYIYFAYRGPNPESAVDHIQKSLTKANEAIYQIGGVLVPSPKSSQ